ncbi:diaminobutyrate--2-oxoglutarate transaminase [Sorangium sp. So ce1024]|uniref:diaminobutyrate--2-oxoglutarate transaminase n=1 Tax=unclassified Sorangium TaxID=2621164 RepID=UPI003EFDED8A
MSLSVASNVPAPDPAPVALKSTLHAGLGAELAERHRRRGPYELGDHPLLERQRQRESNARSYPRRLPLALSRAQGVYVEDVEGRVFIDCLAGAGTLALGHNHPAVIDALMRTLHSGLPLHTLDITTPVKDRFVQDVLGVLPATFARHARIQFCGPTGADAVEAALKLVRTATGRGTVLAFQGAYHGMTQGALTLMGNLGPKVALGTSLHGVQFLPYPYGYRCPFGLGGDAGVAASLAYIENLLSDPESGVPRPAAIILEAVQGEGGVIPAPVGWLQGLRGLATRYEIPLIVDEVQTGFGRTGRMFAFEHAGIEPDVLVLSKALGGGLPLSVVVYHERFDTWRPGAHAGTFRGNQLAMAAGSATLAVLRAERLDAAAAEVGARLQQQLTALTERFGCIGEVRGRGLMLGVELVDAAAVPDARGARPAHPELAARVQRECLRRGLILELGGRHGGVVRFLPPLVITAAQVDEVARIFGQALAAACA